MTHVDTDRLVLEGPVTFATVPGLLEQAASACRAGACVIDFSAVAETDSAALALALELLRQAENEQRAISFANLPAAMHKLAELYSVTDIVFPR